MLPRYPRTYHIEGSKGGDPEAISISSLAKKYLVIEEKMDGSMVSIYFDDNGDLHLRHRNKEVRGVEFDLLKRWTREIEEKLFDRLGDQFIMYGEWLFACHTIFYDKLPSYFLEYDVYDRAAETFLSTLRRKEILFGMPIHSVLILDQGEFHHRRELEELVTSSNFASIDQLETAVRLFEEVGLRRGDALKCLDLSLQMEGLYIKHEDESRVLGRYKYIRKDFIDTILRSGHWKDRPLVQNQLDANRY